MGYCIRGVVKDSRILEDKNRRIQLSENCRKKAYTTIDKINWSEGFYRKDIGKLSI